jgi:hypothetical protein
MVALQTVPVVADRILLWGPRLALVAAAISLAATVRPDGLLDWDLDPSGEGNAFAWASTVATFAAAFASLLLALAVPAQQWRFALLSVCFAYLSLDDMTMMHERLGARLWQETLNLPENVAGQLELLLYAPLFVAAIWIVWSLHRTIPSEYRVVLISGVALLGAAVACEFIGIVTRRIAENGTRFVNTGRVGVEEAAELAGWVLVAVALTALACEALASSPRRVTAS